MTILASTLTKRRENMNWEGRSKIIVRWAVATVGATALVLLIWFRVAEVPVTTVIRLTPNLSYILPTSISRWWDVLAAPIWSTIFILFFTCDSFEEAYLQWGLVTGLVLGLLLGPKFGLSSGLISGLILGLAPGLASGLRSKLDAEPDDLEPDNVLVLPLGFWLLFGLASGLGFGLPFGLILGLVFELTFVLAYGLSLSLSFFVSRFGLSLIIKQS